MKLPEAIKNFTQALDPFCSESELAAFEQQSVVNDTQQALEKINIYRHSISHSHVDTLLSIFPVCVEILGEDLFAHWAKKFYWHDKIEETDLNFYGKSFPEFIEVQLKNTDFSTDYSYLPDLATIEYHWNQAFFAENDPQFDFNEFAQLTSQKKDIIFQLSHSLYLMSSEYPIFEIWSAHRDEKPTDSVPELDEPEFICIHRPEKFPTGQCISLAEFSILQACQNNRTLSEMASDESLTDAMSLLPKLIERRQICGIRPVPPSV